MSKATDDLTTVVSRVAADIVAAIAVISNPAADDDAVNAATAALTKSATDLEAALNAPKPEPTA